MIGEHQGNGGAINSDPPGYIFLGDFFQVTQLCERNPDCVKPAMFIR
jgi:hypothetical protein